MFSPERRQSETARNAAWPSIGAAFMMRRVTKAPEGRPMRFIVSGILAVAGALAALFIGRDAGNFPIVQGATALLLVVVVVALVAFLRRRS
jgi:uncharacterized membrane protein